MEAFCSKMKTSLQMSLVCLAVITLAGCAGMSEEEKWRGYRHDLTLAQLQTIQTGMSVAEVTNLFGAPTPTETNYMRYAIRAGDRGDYRLFLYLENGVVKSNELIHCYLVKQMWLD